VSLFTGVIFTVRSVTVGVWLFTFEGTESISSVVVPACTFSSLGCSNIVFLSVFFSFLKRKKLTIIIQHILELKFYIPLVLFGNLTHILRTGIISSIA